MDGHYLCSLYSCLEIKCCLKSLSMAQYYFVINWSPALTYNCLMWSRIEQMNYENDTESADNVLYVHQLTFVKLFVNSIKVAIAEVLCFIT